MGLFVLANGPPTPRFAPCYPGARGNRNRQPPHPTLRHAPQSGEWLGHDIKMLAGLQRNVSARAQTEAPRPHPRGDNDILGENFAIRRCDTDCPTVPRDDRIDSDILNNSGATRRGALDERHCGVDRIGLPVTREVHAANDIPDVQCKRCFAATFFRTA
jgi:hypothetical protein